MENECIVAINSYVLTSGRRCAATIVYDTISMFNFSLRASGVNFDSSSTKAGKKVPGPCTPGRIAAVSEAMATAEILMAQRR